MSRESQNTRTRILTAALKLLETGEKTRMTDIARAAGISRQALYLHFETHADLLIAVTRHVDELNNSDDLLAASRAATTGVARLDAYIEAWGGYIPVVYKVAKPIMAMAETDEAARAAWNERMAAMRHGCAAAVDALARDGRLRSEFDAETATDILWAQLSVPTWVALTEGRGWSQADYIARQKLIAKRLLVA
ncbi:MAG: TetR family transcriptional regulator [Paracoccaceae bacterium]|nr:TetR family transcriptional regulator [Paracoccaceae bacterium]MDG1369795.1 TetR family transcriptional regulator [Paracoccaceae bacterium]